MSDFLSNFQGGNYEKTRQDKLYEKSKGNKKADSIDEPKATPQEKQATHEPNVSQHEPTAPISNGSTDKYADLSVEELLRIKKQERKERQARREAAERGEVEPVTASPVQQKAPVKSAPPKQQKAQSREEVPPIRPSSVAPGEELTEIDPSYRRKKIIKYVIFAIIAIVVALGGYFAYYQFTHVEVPDFTDEELSQARAWATENEVVLKVEQVYDFDKDTNQIISQSVTKKKIKKGSELTVNASLGPDPEENIALPDFTTMAVAALKEWIVTNKADNLSVIEENNETKPAGEFIKLEMVSKDVTAETYKRKDKAKVYYSKGAEVLEKTIEVPDFAGKTKEEVEEWTKKNELTIQTSENNSDTVESGKVISQEIAKGTKVAKKDKFPVVISIGKAYVVPDFSHLTMEEAEGNADNVSVKQIYNDTVAYGGFVSQSVEAGQSFKEAERPAIQLVYSIGKPFMRDLRNSTLEGEIQKIFYDEYQSKGAGITYQVYYVDSAVTKGTVVDMSQYNEFVATNAVIRLGVSKGNIQNQDAANEPTNDASQNTPMDDTDS